MPPSFPPLPPDQVALVQTGVSMLVASCGPDQMPAGARAVGLVVWPDACRITVFLPDVTSATCRDNLGRDGRIALVIARMADHFTIQLKGKVLAVRPARNDERAVVERYIEMFSENLAAIGMSSTLTRRLTRWPATAIDFEIGEVYCQTPGANAGRRMPLAAAR